MWRTADGVLHTVALPDPTAAFTDDALAAALDVLAALDATTRSQVVEQLAMVCVMVWDLPDRPVDAVEEQQFHAVAVPAGTFAARPTSVQGLQDAVALLEARWQLDVALALEDVVDALGEDISDPRRARGLGEHLVPSPTPWPTAPGGLSSDHEWDAVEVAVADVLAALTGSGARGHHDGLQLAYLPFTDLGRADGYDLSWEASLTHPGALSDAVAVALAEHPLPALQELLSARLLDSSSPSGREEAPDLVQRWSGWSVLLRRAAEVAARGPASSDEVSPAGFDLSARRSTAPGADDAAGWVWRVGGIELLDASGATVGEREWTAASPSEALRAALAEADTWF